MYGMGLMHSATRYRIFIDVETVPIAQGLNFIFIGLNFRTLNFLYKYFNDRLDLKF
jgi:hypothetical protein